MTDSSTFCEMDTEQTHFDANDTLMGQFDWPNRGE